ncbi:hypothetical protein PFISCL1PPCAC_18383, partial [Pristionchus fissidentatus]
NRKEKWKCDSCYPWWPVPKWGGRVAVGRVSYKVVNTCPLDSILAIVISYYKSNPSLLSRIGSVSPFEKSLRGLLQSENVNEEKEKMIYNHHDQFRFDKGSMNGKIKQKENNYNLMSSVSIILEELSQSASKLKISYDCDI